jgi:hypothetical protein
MTAEEALALLDSLLPGQQLKDVQELVFRYVWQGWSYPKIAEHTGYETGHIRDVGSQLWKQLSQAFGEQVTKKNVHLVLRQRAEQHQRLSTASNLKENEPSTARKQSYGGKPWMFQYSMAVMKN